MSSSSCLDGWVGHRQLASRAESASWAGPRAQAGLGRERKLGWAESAGWAGPRAQAGLGRERKLGWAKVAESGGLDNRPQLNYYKGMSTVGQKQIVALTGLGLSLFVLVHMLGNVLIFIGPEAYNTYSHQLVSNPLIIPMELGLLAFFVTHLVLALKLTFQNARARRVGYAMAAGGDKATSFVAKSLWHQGIVLLVFVVWHLVTFKFGPHYEVTYNGQSIRDLHRLVVEVFQSPLYVAGYMVALVVLALHLSHGVASALQSLGLYWSRAKCLAQVYALVVGLGFILQPLYVYVFYKG